MRLKAQASLAILAVITIVIVMVSVVVSETTYHQYTSQRLAIDEAQTFTLTDSGLEIALLELEKDFDYNGQTLTMPEGNVTLTVTDQSGTQKQIVAQSTTNNIRRELTAVATVTSETNPMEDIAFFGGDDVQLIKSHAELIGNLWTNDNADLDASTIVRGNIYAAGQGNGSNTGVRNGAQVLDNPNTAEVEGNVYAIDRIRVLGNAQVANEARSKNSVNLSSGGTVGSSVVDPNLVIGTIQVPGFSFDAYKAQAQAAGTYYSSAAQFLNYLNLNGRTITGGVHYINSGTLTLNQSHSYNITGSIISNGSITIQATSYVHTAENNLPALASKGSISFTETNNCNCTATVNGIVYASGSITLKHDQFTGGVTHAVNVTGALWAGDTASIEDHSKLTFDQAMVNSAEGFNFQQGGGVGGQGNNLIEVLNWSIE